MVDQGVLFVDVKECITESDRRKIVEIFIFLLVNVYLKRDITGIFIWLLTWTHRLTGYDTDSNKAKKYIQAG